MLSIISQAAGPASSWVVATARTRIDGVTRARMLVGRLQLFQSKKRRRRRRKKKRRSLLLLVVEQPLLAVMQEQRFQQLHQSRCTPLQVAKAASLSESRPLRLSD